MHKKVDVKHAPDVSSNYLSVLGAFHVTLVFFIVLVRAVQVLYKKQY